MFFPVAPRRFPVLLLTVGALLSWSADSIAEDETAMDTAVVETVARRHADFEARMSGSSLLGRFTKNRLKKSGNDVQDAQDERLLTEERYDILSAKKAEKGDFWIISTRIRYGELDVTVPVPVEVKWAGETPVIMLDHVAIPGLGTFDAHVLIHKDSYAGTWRHDDQGGHLFGKIERTLDKKED